MCIHMTGQRLLGGLEMFSINKVTTGHYICTNIFIQNIYVYILIYFVFVMERQMYRKKQMQRERSPVC